MASRPTGVEGAIHFAIEYDVNHPMPMAAPGWRRPFREEAQSVAVQCPGCGGPLTLRGFGGTRRVTCPYCGTESSPADHGALAALQIAQRKQRVSALPLYRRGTFEGTPWEILGIVWRETSDEGVTYPWQEFLLFNPYRGYRYLIYSMTDGHWLLGGALDGAPQVRVSFGSKTVSFRRVTYRHFQTSAATVTYVEGEFPWEVHVGDQALAHDYVAPPDSISVEESVTEHGQDLNFTRCHHVAAADVWKAFGLAGAPPRTAGVGMCQPNPWRTGRGTTWLSFTLLVAAWLIATAVYAGARTSRVVFSRSNVPLGESLNESVEITSRHSTTLELEFTVSHLSNAWATADVALVPQGSEQGITLSATAERWEGVAEGESWSEGDLSPTMVVGGVPPGAYQLYVSTESGTQAGAIPEHTSYTIQLREDVVLLRYVVPPLIVILVFPLMFGLFGLIFESRRWSKSDHASSGD